MSILRTVPRGLLLGLVLVLFGCQTVAPKVDHAQDAVKDQKGEILASMGNRHLYVEEFQALLNHQPLTVKTRLLGDKEAIRAQIRQAMVRKFLREEAMAQDPQGQARVFRRKTQAEEEVLRTLFLASLTRPPADFPDQETLSGVYETFKEQFKQPARVHCLHILVAFGDDKLAARTKSEALLVMARRPENDFSTLARKHSQDPVTASRGGDLGWLPVPVLTPSFKKAINGLAKGAVADLVETERGFHIIKKLAYQKAKYLPMHEVADKLKENLRKERSDLLLRNLLQRWNEEYPMQIISENVPGSHKEKSGQNTP